MATIIYAVRHCRATGQAPDAPLTPEGEEEAIRLADHLAPLGVGYVVSSPWRRAVQSIEPLAARLALPIATDPRLVERALSGGPLDDWQTALRTTFDDLDMVLDGGESSRAAQTRAVAALEAVRAHPAPVAVVVTHGNLLALLLRHFDPTVGFETWQALTNPDIFRLTMAPDGRTTVQRAWP